MKAKASKKNKGLIKITGGIHFWSATYTTGPALWKTYTNQQSIDAYNHFFQWIIMHEDQMDFKNAELAWDTLYNWKEVCIKRGISPALLFA